MRPFWHCPQESPNQCSFFVSCLEDGEEERRITESQSLFQLPRVHPVEQPLPTNRKEPGPPMVIGSRAMCVEDCGRDTPLKCGTCSRSICANCVYHGHTCNPGKLPETSDLGMFLTSMVPPPPVPYVGEPTISPPFLASRP